MNIKAENGIIDFYMIDQLELVSSNSKNEIKVISKNKNTQPPTVILEEKNGPLFIKCFENSTSKEITGIFGRKLNRFRIDAFMANIE